MATEKQICRSIPGPPYIDNEITPFYQTQAMAELIAWAGLGDACVIPGTPMFPWYVLICCPTREQLESSLNVLGYTMGPSDE